ncbi:hypothetical protein AAIO65_12065 [Erwinia amylovora]|uniref:hypothetical protein n=1 Tax=Erwinia amylovora TaxID=552 RepID=UPI0035C69660
MPIVHDLQDLTHWKTVQEFSVTQSALLLAGIDPYDFEGGLDEVRNRQHERWKLALGLSEGIVSAIRRGVLTPVQCVASKFTQDGGWGGHYEHYDMKPTDRKHDINKDKTIITRDSLLVWVECENVDFVRKFPSEIIKDELPVCDVSSTSTVIDVVPDHVNNLLLLPKYEHQSEGLEYVRDAIRELWSTYDEDDPQTAPKKDEVINYLRERGAGVNMADAVNLILRPGKLQGIGRRPRKTNR